MVSLLKSLRLNAVQKKRKYSRTGKYSKAKKSKGRVCSICHKPGHNSTTCPENKPEKFGFEEGTEDDMMKPRELTRKQYEDARLAQQDGLSSLDVANEMNVNIGEINAVFAASSYEDYKRRRVE